MKLCNSHVERASSANIGAVAQEYLGAGGIGQPARTASATAVASARRYSSPYTAPARLAPDPDDKRGQLVRLTADGLRLFDEVAPLHLANEDRLLSSLSADERITLAQLLRKLLLSFESGSVQVGLPLGMRLEPAHVARHRRTAVGLSDTPGLLITDTIEGAPAATAGLDRGDLIVAANGTETRGEDALAQAIDRAGPGGQLRISALRGDEPRRVTVHIPARQ